MVKIKEIGSLSQSAYFGFVGTLASALWQSASGTVMLPSIFDAIWIGLLIAFIWLLNQIVFTRAYTIGRAPIMTLIFNVNLVYAYGAEILFYNETPALVKLFGTVLILASVCFIILSRANLIFTKK
jgi:drug/metabolite transporter (DMT)-like permease